MSIENIQNGDLKSKSFSFSIADFPDVEDVSAIVDKGKNPG